MKFICDCKELLKIVNTGEIVSSSKIDFSSASMVLLETTSDMLNLKASNLNVTLEAPVECTVENEGAVSINQMRLASLLRELHETNIKVELRNENIVNITPSSGTRKIKVQLYGVPPGEFPELPTIDERKPFIAIEKNLFKHIIASTAFAAAAAPTQYALNGVYMTYVDKVFSMVTTDGRRMAIYSHPLGETKHEEFKVILSRDFLKQLQRALVGEGALSFAIDDNRIFIKADNMLISSLFIDGDYPNYRSFIPKSYTSSLTIDTTLFKNAIKTLLAAYTNIELSFNKILLNIDKKSLKITSRTKNSANTDEELGCDYDGEATKIAFNVKMLNEIIEHIEDEKISLSWNDSTSPVRIKGDGNEDCHYILMPVKEGDF
ncbi:DNA polymerase III subunit beta [Spirochaetota bacterium]|nr:DNA polymerase III subunit beta [Spirochaetota bacterium]